MSGFVIFIVATVILIFGYPTPQDAAPGGLVALWHLGALMVCSIRSDLQRFGQWEKEKG